jgi:hypothetical protein
VRRMKRMKRMKGQGGEKAIRMQIRLYLALA